MRHARHVLTVLCCFIGVGILAGWIMAREAPTSEASAPVKATTGVEGLDRTVLPIPEPETPPITVLDARNAKAPPRFEVKAPKDAPNVLIVLIDDMGFGQSSAFGGPIHMPTAENDWRRAGCSYNQFHTTALCSPTRAALLTGPQPSRLQHGLDHRDGHRLPRPDRAAAQQRRAAGRDAPAQRLQHRRVRQVARDRRLGSQPLRARPTAGRPAPASTSSTASSAARPTSGRRRSTKA